MLELGSAAVREIGNGRAIKTSHEVLFGVR